MAFKDRLKEARRNQHYTQKQLGEIIGAAGTTITGYEKGNSEPNILVLSKIMNALKVDANFLFQDEIKEMGINNFSLEEKNMVEKYRNLDNHGKKIVDLVLNEEFDRITSFSTPFLRGRNNAGQVNLPLVAHKGDGVEFIENTPEQDKLARQIRRKLVFPTEDDV